MKDENLEDLLAKVAPLLDQSVETRFPPPALKAKIMDEIDRRETTDVSVDRPRFHWGFAMAAAFVFAIWAPTLFRSAPVVGRLAEVRGRVSINGRPVTSETMVRLGQRLETGTGASAELHLASSALVKLKSDTALTVDSNGNGYALSLSKGATHNLVRTGTHYALKTPTVTAEARGTGFFVEVLDPNRTYVCICNGHIVIKEGRFEQDLQAVHHKAVIAHSTPTGTETAPGPMIDHTDEEAAELMRNFK